MALVNIPDNKIVLDYKSLSELMLTFAEDDKVETIAEEMRGHLMSSDGDLRSIFCQLEDHSFIRKELENNLRDIQLSVNNKEQIIFSEYQNKYKELKENIYNNREALKNTFNENNTRKIFTIDQHMKVVVRKIIVEEIKKILKIEENTLLKQ